MEDHHDFLKSQLSEEELNFFNELAASYQKNFVIHIFNAKRKETQDKNLKEVKEALALKCKNIFDYKKKINPKKEDISNLTDIEKIKYYFEQITIKDHQTIIKNLYFNLLEGIPNLQEHYGWNQPMLKAKSNKTFIAAFSTAKNHFSIGLENDTLQFFKEKFEEENYELLKKGIKIKWEQNINENLLKTALIYTLEKKKDAKGFWE